MQISLKAARVNAGLTQKEAAAALGTTRDTVGNWERGKSFPDAPQIGKIVSLYGVPYDNLIFCPKIRFKRIFGQRG